jgi:glycosyltransferase involved in cell wall biosynthesis
MRIAQVAPLAESVPPKLYGGTERVVAWLIEELVELGHAVTLFASGDSRTRARLVAACPRALRLGRPKQDPAIAFATLLASVAEEAVNFDLIHCHIDWVHLPLLSRLRVPFLTTLHGRLDIPSLPNLLRCFERVPFISISESQRTPLPKANWIGTVYHGLPPDLLRPRFGSGQYLAFLGRLSPDKGPEVAIEIARKCGMKIRIAAKVPRGDAGWFKDTLAPMIDADQVQLVGEVNDQAKEEFLGNAAALLFPIDWPEPFGLVMIEAMACATPVIAYRRGSVAEIVDHGSTGFIVDDEAGAIAAVARLGELDRRRVRAGFEERFSSRRMAHEYVRHYRALTGLT